MLSDGEKVLIGFLRLELERNRKKLKNVRALKRVERSAEVHNWLCDQVVCIKNKLAELMAKEHTTGGDKNG